MSEPNTAKLSQLQRRILAALLRLTSKPGDTVKHHAVREIAWEGQLATPAARASFAKALSRLEARGLLVREFWFESADPNGRTRRVETTWSAGLTITLDGIKIAKRLTGVSPDTPVSRFAC